MKEKKKEKKENGENNFKKKNRERKKTVKEKKTSQVNSMIRVPLWRKRDNDHNSSTAVLADIYKIKSLHFNQAFQ